MKAIVNTKYGSPDILELKEIEKPEPKAREVLVKVQAASVNPLDWHFLRGTPYFMRLQSGIFKPKITILGADAAGVVEAVGSDVRQFKIGDAVIADLFNPDIVLGALAEYACIHEDRLVKKPSNLTFEESAAVPVAALTALAGLRDYGKIQAGQKVLINGASGGVGTFAVQIAKSYGAHVTGVCSTRNLDMVKSIGADCVIDYTKEDFTHNRERYDIIFDAVGNLSISSYKTVAKPGGYCAVVGYGGISHVLKVSLFGGKRIKMVQLKGTKDDLDFIMKLIAEGKVKPVIDRQYKLSQTSEAIHYLEKGHARGKVIIKI